MVEKRVRFLEIGDRIESGDLYDDGRMIVLYSIEKNHDHESSLEPTIEFAYDDTDISII